MVITTTSSAQRRRDYSLHGLVRVQVCSPRADVIRFYDAELGHFRAERPGEAELTIVVDRFTVDRGIVTRMTDRNAAADGLIVGADRHKVARWRFALEGLEQRRTRLYCDGGPFSLGFLQHRYGEQLLSYKLTQRGYTMVHGCCLARDGRSALLPGLMHTGKTTLALHLVRRGWEFQADDYTIVGDGATYSYPRRLHFASHASERYPEALAALGPRRKAAMAAKRALALATFGYGDLSEAIGLRELIPNAVIADRAELGGVIFLTPYSGTRVEGPFAVAREAAAERLLAINAWEGLQFMKLLLEANALGGGPALHEWQQLRASLARQVAAAAPCAEILIPQVSSGIGELLSQVGERVEQALGAPAQPLARVS